ncbi:MAG: Asd/ArgC dimerization domain-containing protein, partial [Candidatus Omnitrophica bacterium]|nr:Asd/ArgC dimerization domain-containing protein [Candidatus Omnitrophota bacterium]
HLLPINQGIYETIYVQMKQEVEIDKMHQLYKKFYKTEKFVRVLKLGAQPEIKNVVGTNLCDIGLAAKGNLLVITSAIDNLIKGAAGQAVQNMNIMYGVKEETGLA